MPTVVAASYVRVGLTETDSGTVSINGSPAAYAAVCVWI